MKNCLSFCLPTFTTLSWIISDPSIFMFFHLLFVNESQSILCRKFLFAGWVMYGNLFLIFINFSFDQFNIYEGSFKLQCVSKISKAWIIKNKYFQETKLRKVFSRLVLMIWTEKVKRLEWWILHSVAPFEACLFDFPQLKSETRELEICFLCFAALQKWLKRNWKC